MVKLRLTPGDEEGFSYLFLLIFLAVMSAGLAAISDAWMTAATREKEAQLLFAGSQYRLAIARYYENSPGALRQYPASLDELLRDPRFPEPRRHLRERYPDPFGQDWIILPAPQGGIRGVASASAARPLKTGGFHGTNSVFEPLAELRGEQLGYRDWEFAYDPTQRALVKP